MFHQLHPRAPFPAIVQQYVGLLEALDRRYGVEQPLALYRLDNTSRGWEIKPLEFEPVPETTIDVRVYAEEHPEAGVSYIIVCNDQEFRSEKLKEGVFTTAAAYIRQLRQRKTSYPVYVSDIDVPAEILGLPSPSMIHTVPVLQYKRRLEQRLNQG